MSVAELNGWNDDGDGDGDDGDGDDCTRLLLLLLLLSRCLHLDRMWFRRFLCRSGLAGPVMIDKRRHRGGEGSQDTTLLLLSSFQLQATSCAVYLLEHSVPHHTWQSRCVFVVGVVVVVFVVAADCPLGCMVESTSSGSG